MKRQFFAIKFSLVFFLLLIISSCKKEEVEPCETLQNIVGTWRLDQNWESCTFLDDYTYIDSIFSGENNETLEWVTEGKFKFINGFLELSDLKFVYLKNPTGSLFRYQEPIYRFELIDNKLFLNEIGICRPQGHSASEIKGKWLLNRLIIIFEDNKNPQSVSGKQVVAYDFNEESKVINASYTDYYRNTERNLPDKSFEYRFDNPFIYRIGYENPIFELDYGFLIQFSENARRVYTKFN